VNSSSALSLDLAPAASTHSGPVVTAIDLSLAHTGYCTSDGRSGVLEPPKGCIGMPRLRWILDSVWNVTEGAELVVIESFVFSAKGSSFVDLANLGLLVRFTMWENERRYVDVNPGTLKVFATGDGHAKKPDMLAAAIKKLAWNGSNDDNVIDARWLLEMARAHYGGRTDAARLTAKQTQALAKIQWPQLTTANT
jgi:crossover junction endodeoxyribonuclease RuvC